MLVSLNEMKHYLRVDGIGEDDLILQLEESAEELCREIARLDEAEFLEHSLTTRIAVLYAAAYLYEHREEADHPALALTLRSLLSGVRKEGF